MKDVDLKPASSSELNPSTYPASYRLTYFTEGVDSSRENIRMPKFTNPDTIGLRRSERASKTIVLICIFLFFGFLTTFSGVAEKSEGAYFDQRSLIHAADILSNVDGTINFLNPVSHVFSSFKNNDTYNYQKYMQK